MAAAKSAVARSILVGVGEAVRKPEQVCVQEIAYSHQVAQVASTELIWASGIPTRRMLASNRAGPSWRWSCQR
ncbi:hypothetical protein AAH979_01565 [Plantactinospora sp. ZYX-F-223]|uniref:hypothetical protein n=1 Tax=Plantactinospora sp. ZYX-F-223 TaxID=3144103 RepID=UPI0031FE0FFF